MELTAPIMVHWEITRACNLHCLHCYQQDDARYRVAARQRELFSIAEKLVEAGVFQVTLTGGEPFLVPCLEDLVRYFNLHGITPQISTNGTLFAPATLAWLSEVDVTVQVSIDSHDPRIHDYLRQKSGAFAITLRNLKRLQSAGVQVTIAFCATKHNFRDVEEVIKLAINNKVSHLAIGEVLPFGSNPTNLTFSAEEYQEFVALMDRLAKQYLNQIHIEYISEWGFLYSGSVVHAPCSAMDRDMAILFDGRVSPCPFIRHEAYSMGDMRTSEVSAIWNGEAAKRFRAEKHLGCSVSCPSFKTCLGGCKAPFANLGLTVNTKNTRCPLFLSGQGKSSSAIEVQLFN